MNREELINYTLAQLQQEARKFGIAVVPKKKEECIEAILQHLEENGPLREMRNMSNPQEAIGEAQPPGPSAQVFTKKRVQNNPTDHFQTDKTEYIPQFCAMMQETMQKQQESIQRQQEMMQKQQETMQKQQETINQLITTLTVNQSPSQVQSQISYAASTPRDTDPLTAYIRGTGYKS